MDTIYKISLINCEMKKGRKKWSTTEKLEVINYSKKESVLKASRQYEVSQTSIYKWLDLFEKDGEGGLAGNRSPSESKEFKRIKRENQQLKELVAEKELTIRIQSEMLKKSQ